MLSAQERFINYVTNQYEKVKYEPVARDYLETRLSTALMEYFELGDPDENYWWVEDIYNKKYVFVLYLDDKNPKGLIIIVKQRIMLNIGFEPADTREEEIRYHSKYYSISEFIHQDKFNRYNPDSFWEWALFRIL